MNTNYDNRPAATTAIPDKPLESIAHAVQRINNAAVSVANFLERFHGPVPETAVTEAVPDRAGPPPYSNSLDRLFGAIDRLESRIESLNALG